MAQVKINSIKISDLSVGDWVKIQGKIRKIDYLYGEDNVCDVPIDIVEPIPITPEILEKNGAKKTEFVKDSGYEFYQSDDLYASRVEGSKWWTIIVRNECREVVKCYVQHIHQLQHALRLASVEKEIEL